MVQYKKGTLNLVADALSRKEDSKDGELLTAVTEIIPQWIEDLALSYEGDRWAFRNFGNISENEEHILLVRNEGSKMLLIL